MLIQSWDRLNQARPTRTELVLELERESAWALALMSAFPQLRLQVPYKLRVPSAQAA